MSKDQKPKAPVVEFRSKILIGLLPIILPFIRKFIARFIVRIISAVTAAIGTFFVGQGLTPDVFAEYGFDIDVTKVATGAAAVIAAGIIFGVESFLSYISTKLVPPPKAILVEPGIENTKLVDFGAGELNVTQPSKVLRVSIPKLKLPDGSVNRDPK